MLRISPQPEFTNTPGTFLRRSAALTRPERDKVSSEITDTATAAFSRLFFVNTPVTNDFLEGVRLEAAHQIERWGTEHDAGKTSADWFWLIGYLAQKVLFAQMMGDKEKALHHTTTTAAACMNWYASINGTDNRMRPGIKPPESKP